MDSPSKYAALLTLSFHTSWIFFLPTCQHPKLIAAENHNGTATDSSDPSDSESGSFDSATEPNNVCGVPERFSWTSSPALIYPPDGELAVKDPTILFYNEKWHVYATTKNTASGGWNMAYSGFSNWDEAGALPPTMVSENPNLAENRGSPQLFKFQGDGKWYLVYQVWEPAYSTGDDPGDIHSWTEPTKFMPSRPDDAIDYWIICDDTDCYLFFTALDGVLYRAKTPKASFPDGFEGTLDTAQVMSTNRYDFFQGVNVYKMAGTEKYLLIISAIGDDTIQRYFRAFTADRLDGNWTPLADTKEMGWFASVNNVTGADWAGDGFNAGEILRTNPDETMTIDTCNMQYLYHGLLQAGSEYGLNEYALGLLTVTQQ